MQCTLLHVLFQWVFIDFWFNIAAHVRRMWQATAMRPNSPNAADKLIFGSSLGFVGSVRNVHLAAATCAVPSLVSSITTQLGSTGNRLGWLIFCTGQVTPVTASHNYLEPVQHEGEVWPEL